ncbi:TBC domain-containing protein [Toxoplasma gondii VEG]|uniref:TBC domain-containing protein n=2 Tax=Toxoplasma gondii TaxID=5811 RepID=V4ZGX3_TOXGV|nr:TBC domain-containing protein [Toxoplasma gondii VEG]KFG46274.1 TBC domain-containing protein [Toxoplasma gondii p89]CEL73766.1 TPA: TBC domain-containing protein [Toxoplasma gondii VEG]
MSFLWSGSSIISFSGLGGTSNTKGEDVPLQGASDRGAAPSAPGAHSEELPEVDASGEQQWRELDEVWSGNGGESSREPQRIGKSLFPFLSNGGRTGTSARVSPSTVGEALPADKPGVCTPPDVAASFDNWRQSVSPRKKSNSPRGDPHFSWPSHEAHSSGPRQRSCGDSRFLSGATESRSSCDEHSAQGSSRTPSTVGMWGPSRGASRPGMAEPDGLPLYSVRTASQSLSPNPRHRVEGQFSRLATDKYGGVRTGSFDRKAEHQRVGRRPVDEGAISGDESEEAPPHHFTRPTSIQRKPGRGEGARGDTAVPSPARTTSPDDTLRDVKAQVSSGASGTRRSSLAGSVPAPSESLLQQRQNTRRQQQELLQYSNSASTSSRSSFPCPSLQRTFSPAAESEAAVSREDSRGDRVHPCRFSTPSLLSTHDGAGEREMEDRAEREMKDRRGSGRPEQERESEDGVAASAARAARRRVLLHKLFGVKNSASGERGERKWQSMEDRNLVHFMQMHRHTFFRRLRRGVPPSHRWNAWKAVCLPPPEHRCACPSSYSLPSENVDSGALGSGFHPQSQPLISCVSSPAAGGVGSALTRTFSSPQKPVAGGPGGSGRAERDSWKDSRGGASLLQSQRQRGLGREEERDRGCEAESQCGREGRHSPGREDTSREREDRQRASGPDSRMLRWTGVEEREGTGGCCRAGGDCRRVYERQAERRSSFFALIMIDVPRTFPDVEVFDKDAQALLCRNLNAFANIHPEVGYCQGMNFIAGLLLLVSSFDEFDAFCVFRALMQRYRLKGFFQEKFPLLRKYMKVFDTLASQQLPELRQHFLDEGVLPAVYLHQWFLTLFVTSLPLRSVCVLWDFLLGEGLHGLLELAVALLKVLTRFIIHLRFEEVVKFLKSLKSSGGGCDDFKVGKMLVKQAAKVQLPDTLLTDLLTTDLAVLMREAEEEEVAEAQARAAGVAAAAAAAAVPEDEEQSNPLVETLTEDEEDEETDRGERHRTHGDLKEKRKHHGRSERHAREPDRGDARTLARGREVSHSRAQRSDRSDDERRTRQTSSPRKQLLSSAFSSWDELPSPCGRSRRESASSWRREEKREAGEESGSARRARAGRHDGLWTSPARRPGGELEEMQVLKPTARKQKTPSPKAGSHAWQAQDHRRQEPGRVTPERIHSYRSRRSESRLERERRRGEEDTHSENRTSENQGSSRQSSDRWSSRGETHKRPQGGRSVSRGSDRLVVEKGVNRETLENQMNSEERCSPFPSRDLRGPSSLDCPEALDSSCSAAASLPQAQVSLPHPLQPCGEGEDPTETSGVPLTCQEQSECFPSSPLPAPISLASSPNLSPFPSMKAGEDETGETEQVQEQRKMLFESSPLHSHLRLETPLSPLGSSRRTSSGPLCVPVPAACGSGVSSEQAQRGTDAMIAASVVALENAERETTTKEQPHAGEKVVREGNLSQVGVAHQARAETSRMTGHRCSGPETRSCTSLRTPGEEGSWARNGEEESSVQVAREAGGIGKKEGDRLVERSQALSVSLSSASEEGASLDKGRGQEGQSPCQQVSPRCTFSPGSSLHSGHISYLEQQSASPETTGGRRREGELERTGEEGEALQKEPSSLAGSGPAASRTASGASPSCACSEANTPIRPSLSPPFSPRQIPLCPEESEVVPRRTSSLSDGADAEAVPAPSPMSHSAAIQHARSPPSSPVAALNGSVSSFSCEGTLQLPKLVDAVHALAAQPAEGISGSLSCFPVSSGVLKACPSLSIRDRDAERIGHLSLEDGLRAKEAEEGGRTGEERKPVAAVDLSENSPSVCESSDAVSSSAPHNFDVCPREITSTGTSLVKGEEEPEVGEQARDEAEDLEDVFEQRSVNETSYDRGSAQEEREDIEKLQRQHQKCQEGLELNAQNVHDEAEREGISPCHRFTSGEREEAVALKLVEGSSRSRKRLQTEPFHVMSCNKRPSPGKETAPQTAEACQRLSTHFSSTRSDSSGRLLPASAGTSLASLTSAEETPVESAGAFSPGQDGHQGPQTPESDECSNAMKQATKGGGSKRGLVRVITRLMPVNKVNLSGLSSLFLTARSRVATQTAEEGPAPVAAAEPSVSHTGAPSESVPASAVTGLEA